MLNAIVRITVYRRDHLEERDSQVTMKSTPSNGLGYSILLALQLTQVITTAQLETAI